MKSNKNSKQLNKQNKHKLTTHQWYKQFGKTQTKRIKNNKNHNNNNKLKAREHAKKIHTYIYKARPNLKKHIKSKK